jgi:hypothetical protein
MKKNELINIIRDIVSEEIRRELPNSIAEVFKNILGNTIQESKTPKSNIQPPKKSKPSLVESLINDEDDELSMKQSLREMFNGNAEIPTRQPTREVKQFAKNPIFNEILNETRPFSQQERTGAYGGVTSMVDGGNYSMDSQIDPGIINRPVSQNELTRDEHIPLSDLPQNISVMDVAKHAPAPVARALTRDYSQMMKLIDKKKGKI